MKTEREKLESELKEKFSKSWNPYLEIADFILADRAKIVAPLVKYVAEMNKIGMWPQSHWAINETLRLAGVKGEDART